MDFWREVNDGRGYAIDGLTPAELGEVRGMIAAQFFEHLDAAAPALAAPARAAGMDRYHTLALPFDHGSYWSKEKRVLPAGCMAAFERMGFFARIRAVLPSAEIYHDDLMWRVVRPNEPTDVGPVHADRWFWDAGNGSIPADRERLKIWVAVYTEPGKNGLLVKGHSHTADHWKRHFEFKHGKMKPVLDETVEELGMELLPLKSGQMVLFHDSLLHGGVVNTGTTCRVSIELTITYRAEEGRRALTARAA